MTAFDVPECVTQTYQGDDGKWWRYCLTCDDGSNKYGRHRRGHDSEADAKMSARTHARDKLALRVGRARYADWRYRLAAARTLEQFEPVFYERFPEFRWATGCRGTHPLNLPKIMKSAQEQWVPVGTTGGK